VSGFPLVARQRKYSSKLLSLAAASEIAGSAVILLLWPRAWALGALLLSFAAIRVSILAERAGEAADGAWAAVFGTLRVMALALSALGALAIIAGLLRLAIA
jgi:hypothetical protein